MIKKHFFASLAILAFSLSLHAQTTDELAAQKAAKEAQIEALKGEVATLEGQIAALNPPPAWTFGSLGTIGLNFSSFNNWVSTDAPNTFASTIGFSGSAFANLDKPKFFWRNSGALNLAKTKFDTDTDDDVDADFETSADAFGISSLYGQKLTDKFAISALGEYRTTVLSNFNDPGFLDLGAGATWTPVKDMVVVFHPLNYNFVFSKSGSTYESSLGCKIVVDYARSLPRGINWKTNLSTFLSYSDLPNYSNWVWVNGFSLNIWKSLGVGFELGLKGNKQEAYNYKLKTDVLSPDDFKIGDLDSGDNPVQSYWLLGITYKL